jgi:hypothetical protein
MFHEEWVLDGGIENLEGSDSIELYNLRDDMAEQNNLAQINTRKRDELLKELIDWQKNIGAAVPTDPNTDYLDKNK